MKRSIIVAGYILSFALGVTAGFTAKVPSAHSEDAAVCEGESIAEAQKEFTAAGLQFVVLKGDAAQQALAILDHIAPRPEEAKDADEVAFGQASNSDDVVVLGLGSKGCVVATGQVTVQMFHDILKATLGVGL